MGLLQSDFGELVKPPSQAAGVCCQGCPQSELFAGTQDTQCHSPLSLHHTFLSRKQSVNPCGLSLVDVWFIPSHEGHMGGAKGPKPCVVRSMLPCQVSQDTVSEVITVKQQALPGSFLGAGRRLSCHLCSTYVT